MTFDDFEAKLTFLSAEQGDDLRTRLMARRIEPDLFDRAAEAFQLKEFSDGPAYTGYIWEYLRAPQVVTEDEVWRRLGPLPSLLVLWDLHSDERVRTPDYFRFPRGAVIQATSDTVRRGASFLPEDLYFCDESAEWVGALTHEEVDGVRFCLWSGSLSMD